VIARVLVRTAGPVTGSAGQIPRQFPCLIHPFPHRAQPGRSPIPMRVIEGDQTQRGVCGYEDNPAGTATRRSAKDWLPVRSGSKIIRTDCDAAPRKGSVPGQERFQDYSHGLRRGAPQRIGSRSGTVPRCIRSDCEAALGWLPLLRTASASYAESARICHAAPGWHVSPRPATHSPWWCMARRSRQLTIDRSASSRLRDDHHRLVLNAFQDSPEPSPADRQWANKALEATAWSASPSVCGSTLRACHGSCKAGLAPVTPRASLASLNPSRAVASAWAFANTNDGYRRRPRALWSFRLRRQSRLDCDAAPSRGFDFRFARPSHHLPLGLRSGARMARLSTSRDAYLVGSCTR
jgi:hypothetical protein